MTTISTENRIAILLDLLGHESADIILERFEPARVDGIRQRLRELNEEPPEDEEIDGVIDEFERFFRFAIAEAEQKAAADAADSGDDKPETAEEFEMSADPMEDLNRLQPFQLAAALEVENARTIALVFEHIESDLAAKVMSRLPSELKSEVFLLLDGQPPLPRSLQTRMLRTVVENAAKTLEDPHAGQAEDSDQKMASILRTMERQDRNELLEALEEANPEKAKQVKSLIYQFEDLRRIGDRHVQKILSEVSSQTLSTALADADSEMVDRVLDNLSRRARESLSEEMSLVGDIKPEEKEAARQELVEVITRLEQVGEITVNME